MAKALNVFKLRRAYGLIETAGVDVGDEAAVSWSFEGMGGAVELSYRGKIVELGDWIRIVGKDGYLYMPSTGLISIEKL